MGRIPPSPPPKTIAAAYEDLLKMQSRITALTIWRLIILSIAAAGGAYILFMVIK